MQIKYFSDTDTLLVMFSENEVVEAGDVDENVNINLDQNEELASITVEHAKQRTDVSNFSFQQVVAQ